MYSINDLKLGTVISHQGEPYAVIFTQHVKVARGGANLKTKLKNLVTGQALEITFSSGDRIEPADLERSKASFLYTDNDRYYFMDSQSWEQFELGKDTLGNQAEFLKEGQEVDVLIYNDRPVSIKLPTKIELKVTESPPGIKGDTAGTANKLVTLETGKQIKTPLFISQGDSIRVNTETGEYVERV